MSPNLIIFAIGLIAGLVLTVVMAATFYFWDNHLHVKSVVPDLYDEIADVQKFHERFGFLIGLVPGHLTTRKIIERFEFMREELLEFKAAGQDLAKQADALIDLVYVAKGTAIMMGLPWDEMWEEVQRANMDKVRGMTHRGNASDAAKPKGWIPPQHDIILAAHGYDADAYFVNGEFVESAGRDDHLEPGAKPVQRAS